MSSAVLVFGSVSVYMLLWFSAQQLVCWSATLLVYASIAVLLCYFACLFNIGMLVWYPTCLHNYWSVGVLVC